MQTKGKLPRAGEYRQLIKGEFLENDQPVKDQPKLPKGRLQKSEWREDGNVNNLIGHRDAPNSASHYYRAEGFSQKDDKYGAYFKGIDTPGQHVPRDKKISFDLQFQGLLVDTRDDDRPLVDPKEWTATGAWDRR